METTVVARDFLGEFSDRLADAVERISKSVVLVNGRERQAASGIVIGADLVLTAAHVLERDDPEIESPDGDTHKAVLIGRDPVADLALLRVEGLQGVPAAMADGARVGDFVLAVGRPSSGGAMASGGIVSAVGGPLRTREGVLLERYLTTDARPYPGFSGGPLVNTAGEVLGVMTSGILGNSSVVIPSALAWKIGGALRESGTIKRGYLGIGSQAVELGPSQRQGRKQDAGLLIVHLDSDGPARKAGLLVGDILVGLDGYPVTDAESLLALLAGDRVGRAVKVEVVRGDTLLTLEITVAERR